MKKRRMLSGALALVMSLMVLASPALAAEARYGDAAVEAEGFPAPTACATATG